MSRCASAHSGNSRNSYRKDADVDREKELLLVLAGLTVLSFLPMFREPWFHESRVNFWEWARREVDELKYGEYDEQGVRHPERRLST